MYVSQTVLAGQIGFTKLIYDENIELDSCLHDGNMIESDELALTISNKVIEGGIVFTLTDKITGEENDLAFTLKYWQGY